MLSAVDKQQNYVLAEEVTREDGPFFCPECRQEVMLKAGPIKIPHFAHWPDASYCAYGSGESQDHQEAKLELYHALERVSGVEKLKVERYLKEVRPDVSFVYQGQYVALEIQMSNISRELLEWRTQMYTEKNIAVLWMPPLWDDINDEDRYAPSDWERYLHTLYFGKVYYWAADLELQPIKFEEYLLEAGRYTPERRSKRYVTATYLDSVSLLDLATVWRKAWKAFPRAKLWCQPFSPSS